jgi:uncharacterized SAM-binding protein YcdF (DUF218 family)
MQKLRSLRRAIIRYPWRSGLVMLCLIISSWLVMNAITLRSAASGSTDAFLVLGGSIRREIHAAELVQRQPEVPVLISQGSDDPCIWLIFQRAAAPMQRVWLEKCAESTFGNFFFSAPILQKWGARKIKLITSASHLPRALWLGRIILGAHGIWVEPEIAVETGVPANRENWLKTGVDLGRGLLWAVASQVYQPHCNDVIPLTSVDLATWRQRGFKCERQGNLDTTGQGLPSN